MRWRRPTSSPSGKFCHPFGPPASGDRSFFQSPLRWRLPGGSRYVNNALTPPIHSPDEIRQSAHPTSISGSSLDLLSDPRYFPTVTGTLPCDLTLRPLTAVRGQRSFKSPALLMLANTARVPGYLRLRNYQAIIQSHSRKHHRWQAFWWPLWAQGELYCPVCGYL